MGLLSPLVRPKSNCLRHRSIGWRAKVRCMVRGITEVRWSCLPHDMLSVNKKKVKPVFFTTFYIINLLPYIMILVVTNVT